MLDMILRGFLRLELSLIKHPISACIDDIRRPRASILVDVGGSGDKSVVIGVFVEAAHVRHFPFFIGTFFVPLLVDFIIRIAGTKHIYNFFESYNLHTYCSDLIESRATVFVAFYQVQTALTQVLYEFSQLFNKEKTVRRKREKKRAAIGRKVNVMPNSKAEAEIGSQPDKINVGWREGAVYNSGHGMNRVRIDFRYLKH